MHYAGWAWALLAVMFFAVSCTSQAGGTIDASQHSTTYTDPKLGWSWSYPSNWHLQTFSGAIGHGLLEGALVTNLDHGFHHPDCGTGCSDSRWDMHDTPDDLVVVELHCLVGGPQGPPSPKPDTAFPLSMETFQRAKDQPSYGAPEPRLWKPLRIHGDQHLSAFVWLGHQASSAERASASRIVSSITKPTKSCP